VTGYQPSSSLCPPDKSNGKMYAPVQRALSTRLKTNTQRHLIPTKSKHAR
jgi:hypothetical protein